MCVVMARHGASDTGTRLRPQLASAQNHGYIDPDWKMFVGKNGVWGTKHEFDEDEGRRWS